MPALPALATPSNPVPLPPRPRTAASPPSAHPRPHPSFLQAVEALKALNVPYLVSLPLVFQTTEEWLDSELGVHPVQVALQVRRPRGLRPDGGWPGQALGPGAALLGGQLLIRSLCATVPCWLVTANGSLLVNTSQPTPTLLHNPRWPCPSWTAALSPSCLPAATPTPASRTPCPTASTRCAGEQGAGGQQGWGEAAPQFLAWEGCCAVAPPGDACW